MKKCDLKLITIISQSALTTIYVTSKKSNTYTNDNGQVDPTFNIHGLNSRMSLLLGLLGSLLDEIGHFDLGTSSISFVDAILLLVSWNWRV